MHVNLEPRGLVKEIKIIGDPVGAGGYGQVSNRSKLCFAAVTMDIANKMGCRWLAFRVFS